MLLHRIRQGIDHYFAEGTVGRRTRIGKPVGPRTSSDVGEPGPPEVVVLKRPVPHGPPDLTMPAAIEKRFGVIIDFCNSMVDLVRLNLMSAPGAHRPAKHLVSSKADLDGQQAEPCNHPSSR